MKIIYSFRNRIPIKVDAEDFDYLNQFKWYVYPERPATRHLYLGYTQYKNKTKPKLKTIYMHREIVNCPHNKEVDHINHSKLDNQKQNLRICPTMENHRNTLRHRTNKSGYKGVSFHHGHGKWESRIRVNRKKLFLGEFSSKVRARNVYNKAAKKYFGEFALLS